MLSNKLNIREPMYSICLCLHHNIVHSTYKLYVLILCIITIEELGKLDTAVPHLKFKWYLVFHYSVILLIFFDPKQYPHFAS